MIGSANLKAWRDEECDLEGWRDLKGRRAKRSKEMKGEIWCRGAEGDSALGLYRRGEGAR